MRRSSQGFEIMQVYLKLLVKIPNVNGWSSHIVKVQDKLQYYNKINNILKTRRFDMIKYFPCKRKYHKNLLRVFSHKSLFFLSIRDLRIFLQWHFFFNMEEVLTFQTFRLIDHACNLTEKLEVYCNLFKNLSIKLIGLF